MKFIRWFLQVVLFVALVLQSTNQARAHNSDAIALNRSIKVTNLANKVGDISKSLNARTISYAFRNGVTYADAYKVVNGAGNVFDLSVFKNLTAKIPGGVNNTNIGKTLFDDALKFKPASGSQKTLLDDILANGDNAIDGVASGSKTEALVDDIFQAQGYTKVDGKYFGDAGSNGFDNVFIKGSIDNPTEIIIIECKQMKPAGNVVLNSPASTGLPAQMSDDWIEYIADQKLLNIGGDKTTLARKILNSQKGFIQKYIVAVDKTAGEVNFLKLGNY